MSGHMNRPKGKQSMRSKNRGPSHYPQNYQKHVGMQGSNSTENLGMFANGDAVYVFCKHLMGQIAEISLIDETVVEGVIRALSPLGDVGLSYALTRPRNGKEKSSKVEKTKILPLSNIKCILIRGVKSNYASNDIKIDGEISNLCRALSDSPEELRPYFSDNDKPEECELDGPDGFPTSEMFDTNKKLYQVSTTYDSSLDGYTVPVDKSQPGFGRLEAHCAEIAKKHESELGSKAQLDDVVDNMLETEESKFSSVSRTNTVYPQRDSKITNLPGKNLRSRGIGRGGSDIASRFSNINIDNSGKTQFNSRQSIAPLITSSNGASPTVSSSAASSLSLAKPYTTSTSLLPKIEKSEVVESPLVNRSEGKCISSNEPSVAMTNTSDSVVVTNDDEQKSSISAKTVQDEAHEQTRSSSPKEIKLEERIKRSTLNPDAPEFKPDRSILQLCSSGTSAIVCMPISTVAINPLSTGLINSIPAPIPLPISSASHPHSTVTMAPFYPHSLQPLYPSHVHVSAHPNTLAASIPMHASGQVATHHGANQNTANQLGVLTASHAAGLSFPITCNGQSIPVGHHPSSAVFSQIIPPQQHPNQAASITNVLANALPTQLLSQHMSSPALIAQPQSQQPRNQLPSHGGYPLVPQTSQQQVQTTSKPQQQIGSGIQRQQGQPQGNNQSAVGLSRQRSNDSTLAGGLPLLTNSNSMFFSSAPSQTSQFAQVPYPSTTSAGAIYPPANASIFPSSAYIFQPNHQTQGYHSNSVAPPASTPSSIAVTGTSHFIQPQNSGQPPAHSAYLTGAINPAAGLAGISGQHAFPSQVQINQHHVQQNQAFFSLLYPPYGPFQQQQQQSAIHSYNGFYSSHQQPIPQQPQPQPQPQQPSHQHQTQQAASLSQQQQFFAHQQQQSQQALQAQNPYALSALSQMHHPQHIYLQHHQPQQQPTQPQQHPTQSIPGQHHAHQLPQHQAQQPQSQHLSAVQPHPGQSANPYSPYASQFPYTYSASAAAVAQVTGPLGQQPGIGAYYPTPSQLQQQASQVAAAMSVGQTVVSTPQQSAQIQSAQSQAQQPQSSLSGAAPIAQAVAVVPQSAAPPPLTPQAGGHV